MSWGTCYSGSNNIHLDFPPLMSDGRLYRDWTPNCKTNDKIIEQNNITNNFEYRRFLQQNGTRIMKQNQMDACDRCCSCANNIKHPYNHHNKYLYKSCTDKTVPFGYENSDLKNMYLSRQELQMRTVAPVLTQSEYLVQGYKNYN